MARYQICIVLVVALASDCDAGRVRLNTLQKKLDSTPMLDTQAACPETYQQCFREEGCVYVPKEEAPKLEPFPQLSRHAGACLKLTALLKDLPPSMGLVSEVPEEFEELEGEFMKIKTKQSNSGNLWLPLANLCGVGQAWTAAPCASLCPARQSWQSCIKKSWCVYVPKSRNKPSDLPMGFREALEPAFGKCVAANGLVGSSPVGAGWSMAASNSTDKGLLVKLMNPDTEEPIHALLSFPEVLQVEEGEEEEPCEEGVDAEPYVSPSLWPAAAYRTENLLQACRCSYWRHVASMGVISEIRTNYQFAQEAPDDFHLVEYGCWRDILSKDLRMPVQFEYIASADKGNYERSDKFSLDETPGLLEWQPPMWARSDKYGVPYDVGHLVMANHFDSFHELIFATNLMTNVVPQLGDMNRFAWLATEYITECAREGTEGFPKENVFVIGGCVWPDDPPYIQGFEKMQRVSRKNPTPYYIKIPDYCWKVLSTPNRGHVAFWIPNTVEAKITTSRQEGPDGVEESLTALSEFVVSLSELEGKLSERQTPQTFELGYSADPRLTGKRQRVAEPRGASLDKNYKPSGAQMAAMGWSLACNQQ